MESIDAFILEPTYRISNNEPVVHLWAKLVDGRSALIRKPFKPYFFIKTDEVPAAKKILEEQFKDISITFENTDLTSMQNEEVTKLTTIIPADVPKIRQEFEKNELHCFEADIRFAYRAMMDWGVHAVCTIKGAPTKDDSVDVDVVFDDPDISQTTHTDIPKLSVLSFDIESDKESGQIYSISSLLHPFNKESRLVIGDTPVKNASKTCEDEKDLIESFLALIREWNPDIITGWNVIDFDFAHIQHRAKKYRIPLEIGRDNSPLKMRIESSFFRDSSAHITGRLVLDGLQLLKSSHIRLPDYKLDTAAKEFSKEEKLIQTTGKQKYTEITRLFNEDKEALLKYNFLDAKLVIDVLENSGVLPLTIKRSLLVGLPPDRVSASIASLDSLYLRELRNRKKVAPVVPLRRTRDAGVGGFVMTSKPGIYDYVIVCDFKSLYPSIMRTFNIDPLAFNKEESQKEESSNKEFIVAPNNAHFSREQGIVPHLIETFWAEREKARIAGDELARYAIKIHMNSMYGVLASPNCRFFDRQIGNAITGFAQFFIKKTAEFIKEKGFEVIYGDTDSVFINLDCDTYEKAQTLGKQLEQEMNTYLNAFIDKEYKTESFLEMEFEKTFIRFVMPTVRGSDTGAKKRYAGLVKKKDGTTDISFTGLEMVRRDWTALAKDFQYALYTLVFDKEDVAKYVREYVADLKSGKLDDKLVYRKALRKDVDEYTKTTPPHVKAAMKLGPGVLEEMDSDIIEYVMTSDGPEPVQNLQSKIDYEHYIEKQLKPIADSILSFYNTSFDDQLKGTSQSSLFDF